MTIGVDLACTCGKRVPLTESEKIVCSCGRELGQWRQGVVVLKKQTPYWGEIPKDEMDSLLAESERRGWLAAADDIPNKDLRDTITSRDRTGFADVLPLPEGSRILDVGAGLGAVATQLAERHRVVALEGVWERCLFTEIRKRQGKLDTLTVINCDLHDMPLADGQFDCILMVGVLEWVALFDLNGPPQEVQRRFLEKLSRLLAPGGMIYIGIENRFGFPQLTGALDHSGLPYTSLLPRWAARWVCSRSKVYRSSFNSSYRTYTYTYYGFRGLFQSAGLSIDSMWIAPTSYHLPTALVPVHGPAIMSYVEQHGLCPSRSAAAWLKNTLKKASAREFLWRTFGGDYIFLLKKAGENAPPGSL